MGQCRRVGERFAAAHQPLLQNALSSVEDVVVRQSGAHVVIAEQITNQTAERTTSCSSAHIPEHLRSGPISTGNSHVSI